MTVFSLGPGGVVVRASFLVLSLSMFFVATAAQGQDPLVPGPGLLPPVEVGPVTYIVCLLYTSPSPRDAHESRMPSSA